MTSSLRNIVFVYGTLKRGGYFSWALETAEFLGEATIEGFDLFDLGPYPFVYPGEGRVNGEVYVVETLDALDKIESYPDLYDRVQIDTPHGKAWVYFMRTMPPANQYTHLPEGTWPKK